MSDNIIQFSSSPANTSDKLLAIANELQHLYYVIQDAYDDDGEVDDPDVRMSGFEFKKRTLQALFMLCEVTGETALAIMHETVVVDSELGNLPINTLSLAFSADDIERSVYEILLLAQTIALSNIDRVEQDDEKSEEDEHSEEQHSEETNN